MAGLLCSCFQLFWLCAKSPSSKSGDMLPDRTPSMAQDSQVPSVQTHKCVPVLGTPKPRVMDKATQCKHYFIPHIRERSSFRNLEYSKVGTERTLSEENDLLFLVRYKVERGPVSRSSNSTTQNPAGKQHQVLISRPTLWSGLRNISIGVRLVDYHRPCTNACCVHEHLLYTQASTSCTSICCVHRHLL